MSAALGIAGCESAAHARVRLPFTNVIIPMTVRTNIRNLDMRVCICLCTHIYNGNVVGTGARCSMAPSWNGGITFRYNRVIENAYKAVVESI